MKLLQNKTNVEAPSIAWPFGNLKNDTGAGDGTPVDKELITDIQQTFEKIFDESGLTANGLPDNETNGFQLYQALRKIFKPYKSYTARHDQSGTSAPLTSPVGMNDIGNIIWSRNGVGEYTGTLTGAFVSGKTILLSENGNDFVTSGLIERIDNNSVKIRTFSAGSPSDGVTAFTFEIRVYD